MSPTLTWIIAALAALTIAVIVLLIVGGILGG
jgi:hypothetical protein